jgi:hypothetical protein
MSRTTVLVLVAVGAGLAGLAVSSTAKRLGDDDLGAQATSAAGPQRATLGWRETYGAEGEQLIFSVDTLEVTRNGWKVRVGLDNGTSVPYEVGDPRATVDRSFGLMLFATGDIEELERKNAERTLPRIRSAARYEPSLPRILEPGGSWTGTISAPGALAAGSWVRVVFGALISVGPAPAELGDYVVWITDSAYQLRA